MEQFELALTPPTTDEIIVGQVDRTRSPELRVVFILGMNEGVFPKTKPEDSVLSDVERRDSPLENLEIDPDTQRRLLDENLFAYIALTRASERLIVTRARPTPPAAHSPLRNTGGDCAIFSPNSNQPSSANKAAPIRSARPGN